MYKIGEFSKICQVSVKTLRYYDRLGLLKPVEVDRFSGYRYYDRPQLERMLLIQKLKRYGFSLEEVMSLLADGSSGAFQEKLREQREKLRWRQMELGMVIQELTLDLRKMEGKGDITAMDAAYEIQLVNVQPMAVLSCRKQMGVDEFGRYYGALYERVAQDGFTPNGIFGAMYHDEEFHREASDIELFIGVRETDRADRQIPSRPCAMTVHRGRYSTLSEAYAALVTWIEANGYEWNDAPYDIYTKTAQNGFSPEDWETEVYFPVRKK